MSNVIDDDVSPSSPQGDSGKTDDFLPTPQRATLRLMTRDKVDWHDLMSAQGLAYQVSPSTTHELVDPARAVEALKRVFGEGAFMGPHRQPAVTDAAVNSYLMNLGAHPLPPGSMPPDLSADFETRLSLRGALNKMTNPATGKSNVGWAPVTARNLQTEGGNIIVSPPEPCYECLTPESELKLVNPLGAMNALRAEFGQSEAFMGAKGLNTVTEKGVRAYLDGKRAEHGTAANADPPLPDLSGLFAEQRWSPAYVLNTITGRTWLPIAVLDKTTEAPLGLELAPGETLASSREARAALNEALGGGVFARQSNMLMVSTSRVAEYAERHPDATTWPNLTQAFATMARSTGPAGPS